MNNNTFIHKYISALINSQNICVDMTLGNGNDSLLLCRLAKKVYGFDINEEAIVSSKQRLKDYNNIIYINDNHINIDKYINERIKLAIFNLGYLPHSDSSITTKPEDTLLAFKKVFDLLVDNGYIIITFYFGQDNGKDEYYLLDKYIKDNNLNIITKYKQNKIESPLTYIIKK